MEFDSVTISSHVILKAKHDAGIGEMELILFEKNIGLRYDHCYVGENNDRYYVYEILDKETFFLARIKYGF